MGHYQVLLDQIVFDALEIGVFGPVLCIGVTRVHSAVLESFRPTLARAARFLAA